MIYCKRPIFHDMSMPVDQWLRARLGLGAKGQRFDPSAHFTHVDSRHISGHWPWNPYIYHKLIFMACMPYGSWTFRSYLNTIWIVVMTFRGKFGACIFHIMTSHSTTFEVQLLFHCWRHTKQLSWAALKWSLKENSTCRREQGWLMLILICLIVLLTMSMSSENMSYVAYI